MNLDPRIQNESEASAEFDESDAPPLLRDDEPALFDVVNADGVAPLLIGCDHGGLRIPESLGDLGLERDALESHIACDIGARQVALHLARSLDAPLLLANYSRLVVDLNRHLDDPTLIPVVSDGIAIPGNANLSPAQRARRIAEMFDPYHHRYARMVADLQARFAQPMILSVHSFTPQLQRDGDEGEARPWHIGLLWDEQRDLAQAVIANLRREPGLCVGENQPYHARDPLGYAMVAHAQARAVEMALVEIRQDWIEDDRGQREAAQRLHRAIAPLLDSTPP